MAFAISNTSSTQSTLTQTGTDTAWSGIETAVNAIALVARSTAYASGVIVRPPVANGFLYRCTTAGTSDVAAPQFITTAGSSTTDGTAVFFAFVAPVITANGDRKVYHCPTYDFQINGTLTIANPMTETIVCRRWTTSNSAIYTSGTFMLDGFTSKFNGVHFTTAMKGANDFQEVSTWDGTWNIRGGTINLAASIKPDGNLPQIFTTVTFTSSALWTRSIRFRSYATGIEFRRDCRFFNIALDAFKIPPVMSAKGFASEYVSEYVGLSAGGVDAKMTIFSLSNQDGQFDFDNYGGGFIEIYNCAKGAALDVRNLNNDVRNCVPLFQQLNFKVTNLAGAARDNVRFTCTDIPTNSPTVLITTASSLKTWDFRNPQVYTGITSGGGLASSTPVLKVWHGSTNIQNLRFPASTAVYRLAGYNVIQQDVSVILGSDTAQTVAVAMTAATNLVLTETQAAALTGISLVASGANGGVVTLTSPRTVSELWQYFRSWKPLNLVSNEWSYDGKTLKVNSWTVVGIHNLSVGEIETTTAEATGVIQNLTVLGNVIQNTPTNLTNVTMTGTLTYNTPTNTDVTFTNSTLATVNNSGAGIVTVKRINSTLTAGINVVSFVPTTLTFTLNGGRIRVLNNLGVEQFNQTTDGTIELLAVATGTWTYRIAKYGNQLIEGSFTIDGTTKAITASFIPDTFVVDTLVNVTAYTDLNTTQKVYDYQSYNLTTALGIAIGSKLSKGFGTLSITGALVFDTNAVSLFDYTANVLTVKTSSIAESTTIFATGNFTQNISTLSNDVKIRALNFDSEIIYNADSLTFYPTTIDRDAGTNAGVITTGGVYRYKFGAVYSGVTMTNPLNIRYFSGSNVSLSTLAIVTGNFVFSLNNTELILLANSNLQKVNRNLLKESLITPEFLKEKF